MKLLNHLLLLLFPILLIAAGEFFVKVALSSVESQKIKVIVYASIGIFLSVLIFIANTYALKDLNLQPMLIGDHRSLAWGFAIGIIVSLASGIGFGILNGHSLNLSNLFFNFDTKIIGNLYPSLTEEIYFRGGVVHLLTQKLGLSAGLTAGSFPFGIIHIIGGLFGKTVTITQILGITLAGLMLSLVYLRFGLLGAISCHLMWNSFVVGWARVYNTDDTNIVSSIEGSWVTCAVLLITSATLLFSLYQQNNGAIHGQ